MSKFSTSTNLGDVRECDFIIEVRDFILCSYNLLSFCPQAMPENLELKLNLYAKLGDLAKPTAVFCIEHIVFANFVHGSCKTTMMNVFE
jgi:hypothetical protein